MIVLTRPNGQPVMLNCDLIESVEPSSDSTRLARCAQDDTLGSRGAIITLTTGNSVIVEEPLEEIERRIVAFKHKIYGSQPPGS